MDVEVDVEVPGGFEDCAQVDVREKLTQIVETWHEE